MTQADIDEGRRLRADFNDKQRVIDEWKGPEPPAPLGPYSRSMYDLAVGSRDIAGRQMLRWIDDHSHALLELALGRDGEVERVSKAIHAAHDRELGHDPYDCCAGEEECNAFARAAIDALRGAAV